MGACKVSVVEVHIQSMTTAQQMLHDFTLTQSQHFDRQIFSKLVLMQTNYITGCGDNIQVLPSPCC